MLTRGDLLARMNRAPWAKDLKPDWLVLVCTSDEKGSILRLMQGRPATNDLQAQIERPGGDSDHNHQYQGRTPANGEMGREWERSREQVHSIQDTEKLLEKTTLLYTRIRKWLQSCYEEAFGIDNGCDIAI